MAEQQNIIMAWSECQVEIAKTSADKSMPTTLKSVGIVSDNTTTLETTDGDTLEARKSGGGLVAREQNEGGFSLVTRIIEPSFELMTTLGLGEVVTATGAEKDDLAVTTHLVADQFAVKVTPKKTGAIGIKAPVCNITYKPGFSDREGNYAELTFDILQYQDTTGKTRWYNRFKKA